MKIVVGIFAGGEGKRIGGRKPDRHLGGRTLLDRAVSLAQQWSDEIVITVRDLLQVPNARCPVIADDPLIEGPLGGLASALRFADALQFDALLTIASDMPFLPADLAARLQHGMTEAPVAIARSDGHLHPVCALWRRETVVGLNDYIATGRTSLWGLAEQLGFTAVDWPSDPPDPFFNINSQQDLLAAERMIAR
ncbi:MAG: molybdenum cofactor guanylyltransferase [Sphingomicrobium sp.]